MVAVKLIHVRRLLIDMIMIYALPRQFSVGQIFNSFPADVVTFPQLSTVLQNLFVILQNLLIILLVKVGQVQEEPKDLSIFYFDMHFLKYSTNFPFVGSINSISLNSCSFFLHELGCATPAGKDHIKKCLFLGQYNVVGRYENLEREMNATLQWLGVGHYADRFPPPDRAFHAGEFYQEYLRRLTAQDKIRFLRTYLLDFLLFGYDMP